MANPQYAKQLNPIVEKLCTEFGITVSKRSLKRYLRKNGFAWKRIRKALKSKRNAADFIAFFKRLQSLKYREDCGKIDLYFFDESGFSLTPNVPYAWQHKDHPLELPTNKNKSYNVASFMSRHGHLESYIFDNNLTSEVIIECFEHFATVVREGKSQQHNSVVIVDNSPLHTSKKFRAKIAEWRTKGMYVIHLPTYSPELNLIEILWRFIKYQWLPIEAYSNIKELEKQLCHILNSYGSEFNIEFEKMIA